jgi:hypothetical protein
MKLPHPSLLLSAVAVHDHDVIVEVGELRLDRIDELRERRRELRLAILHVPPREMTKRKSIFPLHPTGESLPKSGIPPRSPTGPDVEPALPPPEPLSSPVLVPELSPSRRSCRRSTPRAQS